MTGIYTYLRCIYFARDDVDLKSACHRDYPQYVQVGGGQICKYPKYKTKKKGKYTGIQDLHFIGGFNFKKR